MTLHHPVPPSPTYARRLTDTLQRNLSATNDLGFCGFAAHAVVFTVATPMLLVVRVLKAIVETASFGVVTVTLADKPRVPSERILPTHSTPPAHR